MIDHQHPDLSIRRQAALLEVNRNRLAPKRRDPSEDERAIMKQIDVIYTERPFYGTRKIIRELAPQGIEIGRKRCRRLMNLMGIEALVPKPSLSIPNRKHRKYPYLVAKGEITTPDEAWAADITYIPMERGHVYLVAIIDWATRAVLSWKLSNTMDTRFCVEAYHEAVKVAGRSPGIMNTDQGSQFTSAEWIHAVESSGARVSMDGKGRWMDKSCATPGLHRATLAQFEIRRAAPLVLHKRRGSEGKHREVDDLLQPPAEASSTRLRDTLVVLSAGVPQAASAENKNTN